VRILLTGASSFTGYWFARALAEAGHTVVAPLRAPVASYVERPRAERVRRLRKIAEVVGDRPFGSPGFLDLVQDGAYDLLCHHAAKVGDYRSPDFDVAGALSENTAGLREILATMGTRGLKAVLLTGSVFEQGEGAGEPPLRAFSAYGLSKGLTAQLVEHRCREAGLRFGKFAIPNPFGPLEEPRFCAYLMRTWMAGETARVNTPAYVRDNIHVDLLARVYARYAADLDVGTAPAKLNPSGYVESQGAFADRYATAMRARLGLACALECAHQTDFPEPLMRVNTDPAWQYVPDWQEEASWDAVAEAYRS
jgi:nucleoside-diphosphate-sugar epimerase